MYTLNLLLLPLLFITPILTNPVPSPTRLLPLPRDLLPILNPSQLSSALASLAPGSDSAYASLLSAIQPSPIPSDPTGAATRLSQVQAAYPSGLVPAGAALSLAGLTDSSLLTSALQDINAYGPCNAADNVNTAEPDRPIYPRAASSDPAYSVGEATLRAAIYFPPEFTNGQVQPVLFFPGTGVEACENYAPNLGKLLEGSDIGDPVYVNPSGNTLQDAQIAAEYVAYAVNYVAGITGRNVSAVTWSQGAISAQWAWKYWRSTRGVVSGHVALSPDYHGTVEAVLICPDGVPCAPAVLQQEYESNFIQTLRANGGDQALVPTTEVHNVFDEVVEPQAGTGASAFLDGASNVEVQSVCPVGTLAGGPNLGHENVLYNPVGVAVVKDTLTNGGQADVGRSGASSTCGMLMAEGLTLSDVLATEALIPVAGFNIEATTDKVLVEPPIMSYAAGDAPPGAPITAS